MKAIYFSILFFMTLSTVYDVKENIFKKLKIEKINKRT